MEDSKDSLTFEIFGFKASAVGRFAVVALLTFSAGVVVSAVALGPAQVSQWWNGPEEE